MVRFKNGLPRFYYIANFPNIPNFQKHDGMVCKYSEGEESNDPDDDELEIDDTEGIDDKKDNEITPGEESDDEAEEDLSSNRDDGGSETGANEEEVFIISFPTSRKRAYSVCLYVSSPTQTTKSFLHGKEHTKHKSHIPRLIKPTRLAAIYPNKLCSHLVRPVIVRTPPSHTLMQQYHQPSRIPRPIATSFELRHEKLYELGPF